MGNDAIEMKKTGTNFRIENVYIHGNSVSIATKVNLENNYYAFDNYEFYSQHK